MDSSRGPSAPLAGSSPVQWARCSSRARWSFFQGAYPRFGSIRCQDCSAQYDPSGALQATTRFGRAGPSYGWQAFLNVFQRALRVVFQPPA